jgi:hypothetical protein
VSEGEGRERERERERERHLPRDGGERRGELCGCSVSNNNTQQKLHLSQSPRAD